MGQKSITGQVFNVNVHFADDLFSLPLNSSTNFPRELISFAQLKLENL